MGCHQVFKMDMLAITNNNVRCENVCSTGKWQHFLGRYFFSSGLTSLRIRISFARGNLCRFACLCSFNGNIKCDFSSHICMFWGHIICCFETQIQFVLMIFTNEWQNNPNVPRLIVNMWCWPGIVMQNKNVHRYLRTHIREYPSLKHNHVIHSFDAVIFASSIKIKPKCNVFVFSSKYARRHITFW